MNPLSHYPTRRDGCTYSGQALSRELVRNCPQQIGRQLTIGGGQIVSQRPPGRKACRVTPSRKSRAASHTSLILPRCGGPPGRNRLRHRAPARLHPGNPPNPAGDRAGAGIGCRALANTTPPPGPGFVRSAGARNHPGTGHGLDRSRPTNRPPTLLCAWLIAPCTP